MSLFCGAGRMLLFGCSCWAWKRCTYMGSNDSAPWTLATSHDFEPVPRICRIILAVYETDLHNPRSSPPGGYGLNPDSVVKRVTRKQGLGRAPPYLIYLDHHHKEIVLAIRGLNLIKESDYKLLLDDHPGMQMFDGGYVHHGLLESAIWLLMQEGDTLKRLWEETGKEYSMVFAGHSLGSGVAALVTVIVVNHTDKLGGISRDKIKCYALAPVRCMSLNLAVKYAGVIYSIILQDDFLPRTSTPLQNILKSIFCLPCLLSLVCLRDTFISEGRKIRDPRRLYAPGRIYHVVERRFCRCGRYPPEVRTSIPVDGRFEHIILSCNATSDHKIVRIESEAEKALQRMEKSSPESIMTAEKMEKMERKKTLKKEHKLALERAVSLNVPHAVAIQEVEPPEDKRVEPLSENKEDPSTMESRSSGGDTNWDEVVKKLFNKNE